METAVVSGLLAGYGIAMPVGVIAVFLIRLGAAACLCIAAAAGLGAASVDGGFAAVAAVGGTGLARQVAAVAGPLHWAAGTALLVVAARLSMTAVRRYRAPAQPRAWRTLNTPWRAYAALAAATLINPLTVLYWAALVLGHQTSASAFTPSQAAVFTAAVTVASASWQLVLVSGGALAGRLAGSRRGMLALSLASSLLIATMAIETLSH